MVLYSVVRVGKMVAVLRIVWFYREEKEDLTTSDIFAVESIAEGLFDPSAANVGAVCCAALLPVKFETPFLRSYTLVLLLLLI
jgi:hypothetical protein